jgi:hypothetical protein
MKIRRTATGIELRTTPRGLWTLGMWFVAGGTFCLAMIAFRPGDLSPTDRLIGALIGTGVLAGGLYALSTSWATRLVLDMLRRRLTYIHRAPFPPRVVVNASFEQVRGTEVRRRHDSDGDAWSDVLLLVDGHDPLPLDSWPDARPSGMRTTTTAIESALRGSRAAVE